MYSILVDDDPLVLYVIDLFLIGVEKLIEMCKRDLAAEFEMKDIAMMHCLLGFELWQEIGEIFLGQVKYVAEILKRFKMHECRPMATPVITNWKKIDALEDKDVDPTLYR